MYMHSRPVPPRTKATPAPATGGKAKTLAQIKETLKQKRLAQEQLKSSRMEKSKQILQEQQVRGSGTHSFFHFSFITGQDEVRVIGNGC